MDKEILKEKYLEMNSNQKAKKYGIFAPYVDRYVDAILELFPDISEQSIQNICNSKIKIQEGIKYNFGIEGVNFDATSKSGDQTFFHSSIKVLTEREDYTEDEISIKDGKFQKKDINIGLVDFLDNAIDKKKSKNIRHKEALNSSLVKTLIHELNHAACYKNLIVEKENGENLNYFTIDLKELKDSRKNGRVFDSRGGVLETILCYDENGKLSKEMKSQSAKMLHEGVTEYLAEKIYSSEFFKDTDDISANEILKNNVSYRPYFDIVGMSEILYNNLLSRLYFRANLESKHNPNIMDRIASDIYPFTKSSNTFIDSILRENYGEQFNQMDILVQDIADFALKQKEKYCSTKDRLSPNEKRDFIAYYKDFISSKTWINYIRSHCGGYGEDEVFEEFQNRLKEKFKDMNIKISDNPTLEQ